jgi:hypothetical protein
VGSQLTYFEFVDELLYGLLVSGEVLGRGRHIGGVKERSNIHRSSINEIKVFIVRVSTEVDQRTALGNLQNCFSWRGIFIGGAWDFWEICAVGVSLRSSSEVGRSLDARLNMLLKGGQQPGVGHSLKKRPVKLWTLANGEVNSNERTMRHLAGDLTNVAQMKETL